MLKTAARAAVVALTLGASALVAMPAEAAMYGSGPSGHVTIGGPQGSVSIGTNGVQFQFGTPDYFKVCLSDRQVVRLIKRNGFYFVRIVRSSHNDNRHNRVWATAVKNHDYYMIRVDRCTHELRARKLGHNDNGDYSHFSPTFNF